MTINIQDYLGLCYSVATKYDRGIGLKDDLVQEGVLGLYEAVKNFDPAFNVPFGTYAYQYVQKAMFTYVMVNIGDVRPGTGKANRKLFTNLHKYRKTGQFLTVAEATLASTELDVPIESVYHMDALLVDQTIYLDHSASPDGDDTSSNSHDLIKTECLDTTIVNALGSLTEEANMLKAVDQLPDRWDYIIKARFLNETISTRQTIAAELGITQQRVAQLESKALVKLRELLSCVI